MPLFKNYTGTMARKSKAPASGSPPPESEKPLPDPSEQEQRPGTSGTEMLLTTNRRQASANFKKAQRAERTYKAKKRTQLARLEYNDALSRLREQPRGVETRCARPDDHDIM